MKTVEKGTSLSCENAHINRPDVMVNRLESSHVVGDHAEKVESVNLNAIGRFVHC